MATDVDPDPEQLPVRPTAAHGAALGQALRDRRKALRISMTAAAEAAGISRVTWHRLEKGETTVALESLLTAAAVLGLEVRIVDPRNPPVRVHAPDLDDWLPLRIGLQDYPQLQQLAWQLREGIETLAPREALGLYERNWRHVERADLQPHERVLIRALRRALGGDPNDV